MQADTMQEQMERVIPAWCTENRFGDDPVTVSTFTQLASKLLSVLPQDPPMNERMLTLQPDMLLADEHCLLHTISDDFATRDQPTLASMGEGFAPDVLLRPGSPGSSPKTGPANTAYGQSPPTQPFPDTSGDWRVQAEREARDPADDLLHERLRKLIKANEAAAAARKSKVRRIAGVTLTLLVLLAGALSTYVWLCPPRGTAYANALMGPTSKSQTHSGNLERESGSPDRATGSLGMMNDVIKAAAAPARDVPQALPWGKPATFRGEIARGLKIEMKLLREGSKVSGSYSYERFRKDIPVKGTIEETGSLSLEEVVNGQKTGIFTGKVVSDERIEGKWSKPDGTGSRGFFLASDGPIWSTSFSRTGRAGEQVEAPTERSVSVSTSPHPAITLATTTTQAKVQRRGQDYS